MATEATTDDRLEVAAPRTRRPGTWRATSGLLATPLVWLIVFFVIPVVLVGLYSVGALTLLRNDVYLSLDLDGLDPAFAPGVSHREPGGLSVREALSLIQDAGGRLVGADVVEYNPRQDVGGVTAVVAAKLVREIAGRMLRDGARGDHTD